MRLALLGIDETTAALARAAQQSGHDQVVLICDVDERERSPAVAGFASQSQSWELLLTGTADGSPPCDAVLVSINPADHERRLEQLRKLAQAGLPMLLSHPVHSSMLAYYELDMIRRETGCIMLPYLPARLHPLVNRLKDLVDQPESIAPRSGANVLTPLEGTSQRTTGHRPLTTSPLGVIDQIAMDRPLSRPDKAHVAAHFARDVDLLRFLGGEVTQLGAMGSPGQSPKGDFTAYSNLAVQMASAENRLLRWWVAPVDEPFGARLTMTGARGKAVLTIPKQTASPSSGQSAWRLEIRTNGDSQVTEVADWDPHVAALDELRAALASPQMPSRWPDAARTIELAETIDRSLAKGRTIVLYEQEYSDAATFKGLMTSLGCALLLMALGAFVVAALAANLLKHAGAPRAAELVGRVPYVLLVFFAIFLALQFLLRLTSTRPTKPAVAPAVRGSPDPAQRENPDG